jgi:hypothetical protein
VAAAVGVPGAGPGDLLHLGRGVAEADPDLVAVEVVDGALVSFLGLVGAVAELPGHDHPHAAGEAVGGVLGGLAPDLAGEELRLPVRPLSRTAVPVPGRLGDPELGYRLVGWGEPQLRVVDEVQTL